jgi:2-phospho-L-lactate/phosphoenolpyruvate guanylyltransferase
MPRRRTLAILPVKRFGAAKQRLAPGLGPDPRAALARAMLDDVLAALRPVSGLEGVAVVTADPAAEAAARRAGATVLGDTEEAGQSPAASIGIAHALSSGFERALLVPGDTPLLDPREVESLLEAPGPVTIVPDRHGTGTNALVLSPPDAIAPCFGPGSRERHEAAASAAGLPATVLALPTLMLDVDTGDDLAALTAALAERPGGAPATRRALRELERGRDRAVRA